MIKIFHSDFRIYIFMAVNFDDLNLVWTLKKVHKTYYFFKKMNLTRKILARQNFLLAYKFEHFVIKFLFISQHTLKKVPKHMYIDKNSSTPLTLL